MAKIDELKFDDKNFNKHTEFGMHLTTGSFLKIEGFIPAIMKNIDDLDLLFSGEDVN